MAKHTLAEYESSILAAAKKYDVPPEHLRALMKVEDPALDPSIVGYDGHGRGLMQIDDRYHDTSNANDPNWNIDHGAQIYRRGRDYLKQNGVPDDQLDRAAFAAYNHGPGNVLANYKRGEPLGAGTTPDRHGHNYDQAVLEELAKQGGAQPAEESKAAPTGGGEIDTLADGTVPMRNKAGEIRLVPPEQLAEALYTHGMTPVPHAEYDALSRKAAIHQKYGTGAGESAKAIGEGLLNSQTSGAGDALLKLTGAETPEALREHDESFGGRKKLAEVGGMIAPMLLGDEAGALGAVGKAERAGTAPAAFRGLLPEAEVAAADTGLTKIAKPLEGEVVDAAARKGLKGGVVDGEVVPSATTPREVTGRPDQKLLEAAPEEVAPEDILSQQSAVPPQPKWKPPTDSPEAILQAHRDLVKKYGRRMADEVLANDPATAKLLEQARAGEAPTVDAAAATSREEVTGAGGRDLYNPMGEMSAKAEPKPEFDLSHSDEVSSAPVKDGVPAAFRGLEKPPRPRVEPLPPEVRNTKGLSVSPDGKVYDPAVGLAPDEVLSPEPEPADESPSVEVPTQQGALPPGPEAPGGAPPLPPTGDGPSVAGAPPPPPPPGVPPPGPAAGPPPNYLADAMRTVTAPNRAIFGMGKKLGAHVENALGGGFGAKVAGHFAEGAATTLPYSMGSTLSDYEKDPEHFDANPGHILAGWGLSALAGGTLGAGLGAAAEGLGKLKFAIRPAAAEFDPVANAHNISQSFNEAAQNSREEYANLYRPGPNGEAPLKYQRITQILGDKVGVATQGKMQFVAEAEAAAAKMPNSAEANAYRQAVTDFSRKIADAQNDAQVMRAVDEFKRTVDSDIPWTRLEHGNINHTQAEALKAATLLRKALEDKEIFGDAADFQTKLNDLASDYHTKDGKKSAVYKFFQRKGVLDGEQKIVFDDAKVASMLKQMNSEDPTSLANGRLHRQVLSEWIENRKNLIGFIKDEVHEPLQTGRDLGPLHDALGGKDEEVLKAIQLDKTLSDSQKKTLLERMIGDRGVRIGAATMLMLAGVPHAFLVSFGTTYALESVLGMGLGRSGVGNALANHSARFGQAIADGLSAAFKGGSRVAGSGAAAFLRGVSFAGEAPGKGDRHENAARVADELAKAASDPVATHAKIVASTKLLSLIHPEVAVQVQAQALQAITYLHQQAPKDPLPPSPFQSSVPFKPGHAVSAKFAAIVESVHNPLALVRDFGNGAVSSEQVAAVKATNPELLQQIQKTAFDMLPKFAKGMDYQKRLAFERLTESKLDWASGAVPALQKNLASLAGPPPNPSAGGAANKPRASTSAKGQEMLAKQAQPGMQSAIAGLS